MDSLLLTTKLQIPPQSHHHVRRERLIDALERGIRHYKLVLISAPAGYGKTTLLSQWAHASHAPVVWLSISPEDNDLERFLRYLLAGWEEVQPDIHDSPWVCSLVRCPRTAKPSYRLSSTSPMRYLTRLYLSSTIIT